MYLKVDLISANTELTILYFSLLPLSPSIIRINGSSAYSEKIFSVMSSKWQNEKNRCSVEIIKNKLFIYFNFKDSCSEFVEKTKDDIQFLKAAKIQTKAILKNKKILLS